MLTVHVIDCPSWLVFFHDGDFLGGWHHWRCFVVQWEVLINQWKKDVYEKPWETRTHWMILLTFNGFFSDVLGSGDSHGWYPNIATPKYLRAWNFQRSSKNPSSLGLVRGCVGANSLVITKAWRNHGRRYVPRNCGFWAIWFCREVLQQE